jgi:signal transduction histidine kinase
MISKPLILIAATIAAVYGIVIAYKSRRKRWRFKKTAESEQEQQRRQAASQELTKLGMSAAFPLVSQGELLGYLLLGEKKSEESYTHEDVLLLRTVANQAALAYQRVRYLELSIQMGRREILNEIASGFAHEIKTPMGNILAPAELTYMDILSVEQSKCNLEEILPSIKDRMREIMTAVLDANNRIEAIRQFSKPDQIGFQRTELSGTIRGSLAVLDQLIRASAIDLQIDVPDNLAPIQGNPKQLEVVFVNLIKNAIEAVLAVIHESPERNKVWISASENQQSVTISIKDSGYGIKRDKIAQVFQPYFTTKGSHGTGVGLFLSHQVIKAHGGSLELQSEEGHGAEFIVRLPKSQIGITNNSFKAT